MSPKTAPPVWHVPSVLSPFCLVSLVTLSGFVTVLCHWNNKRPFSRPVCAKTGVSVGGSVKGGHLDTRSSLITHCSLIIAHLVPAGLKIVWP